MASTALLQAQTYNITDLGALPGDNTSAGNGLNSAGQAAGTSSNPTGGIATLFSGGKAISLGTLGVLDVSFGAAVNALGEAVGYDYSDSTSPPVAHAFQYSNGRMVDIHSPSLFPSGTLATGINRSGGIIGYGWINSSAFHPFLYTAGRMVDLGTLGGIQASALAINDAGTIVGLSVTSSGVQHAFVYSSGKMTDLGPPGTNASGANAINGSGQIAGSIWVNNLSHAALYSQGVWTDLGAVPGALGTQATGINDSGQIIGTAVFQAVYKPFKPGRHTGFIVRNGALIDLDTLIPVNSGFTVSGAIGINDSGEILCNAKTSSGASHAVLLTPR
jgi:probable HAF family extracellular repeat protein